MANHTTFLDPIKDNIRPIVDGERLIYKSDGSKTLWERGGDPSTFFDNYFEESENIKLESASIDLRSDNPKLVMLLMPGISHLFLDRFALGIEWLNRNKDGHIVFAYDGGQFHQKENENDLFYFFNLFNKYVKESSNNKNKCFLIKIEEHTKLVINNYVLFKNYNVIKGKYKNVMNLKKIRDFYSSKEKPYKKIYISRKKSVHKPIYFTTGTKVTDLLELHRFDDERCENEELLEEYFKGNGFEIIYPEDFKTMEEQIRFFTEVKLLICLTHSGISNMIWLPDNSNVIEVSVPIVANKEELFETMWSHLAFCAQHTYTSIPSFLGTAEDVINKIENNKMLKSYIMS